MSLDLEDTLESLSDVLVKDPVDGQVVVYDAAAKVWKNAPQGGAMAQEYIQMSTRIIEDAAQPVNSTMAFAMTIISSSGSVANVQGPLPLSLRLTELGLSIVGTGGVLHNDVIDLTLHKINLASGESEEVTAVQLPANASAVDSGKNIVIPRVRDEVFYWSITSPTPFAVQFHLQAHYHYDLDLTVAPDRIPRG